MLLTIIISGQVALLPFLSGAFRYDLNAWRDAGSAEDYFERDLNYQDEVNAGRYFMAYNADQDVTWSCFSTCVNRWLPKVVSRPQDPEDWESEVTDRGSAENVTFTTASI